MQYISVEDFRKKLNKKDSYESYIRRLCRDGKLEYITEESEKGNSKYMINLEGKHAKRLLERSSTDIDIEPEYTSTINQDFIGTRIEAQEEPENIRLLIEELSNTRQQLVEFAQQAGQAKLLTDNLISKEKDTKYWQDKYFEIQAQLSRLNYEIEALNKQIQALQDEKDKFNNLKDENEQLHISIQTLEIENKKLKQKSFFGIKFSK